MICGSASLAKLMNGKKMVVAEPQSEDDSRRASAVMSNYQSNLICSLAKLGGPRQDGFARQDSETRRIWSEPFWPGTLLDLD